MPFQVGKIDFRFDTLLNTGLICLTLIIGFWMIHHQLAFTAKQNVQVVNRMVSVTQDLTRAVDGQGTMSLQLGHVETEVLQLMKKEDDNMKVIAKLEKELLKKQRQ